MTVFGTFEYSVVGFEVGNQVLLPCHRTWFLWCAAFDDGSGLAE